MRSEREPWPGSPCRPSTTASASWRRAADLSTVGVVLPVPSPFQERLDGYRTALAGEAPETPAHITLVPPTDVGGPDLSGVVEHLVVVAARVSPFAVHLRGTGTFRPATPVVYLEVADGAQECSTLAALTRTGPLRTPARFPYHPHVTIAHRLADAALDRALGDYAGFEAGWTASEFTLYEHGPSGWMAMRSFPLSC